MAVQPLAAVAPSTGDAVIGRQRRRGRATRWLVIVTLVLLLPLPWMQGGLRHGSSRSLVVALDGVELATPDLRYLTVVGYYPLGQAIADWLVRDASSSQLDLMRADPPDWLRPVVNEPVAAAMGLRAAGQPAPLRLSIEGDLPNGQHVRIDRFNGRPIRTGPDLVAARELLPYEEFWFSTRDGQRFAGAPSDVLSRMQLRWSTPIEAHTTGGVPFGHIAAVRDPVRELPVGASHTLMVAVAAYEHASGEDLTRGRRVAGTGALDPLTGTVGRIGGLELKARAAADDGAEVLLFPASQADELEGQRFGRMRLVPVHDLDGAIAALRG
ncbi:hypothetical protein FTX61_15185 [Nitriliruptoraceae bacterium ZYF776]|nr:hypothetical protein [Profundirhabdus halotolerans]